MVTRYQSRKGFTLVEILIVVIILGILAAIVIPQFTSASQDARRSAVQSTVQSVRSQVELYKLQHGDTLPDIVTSWAALTAQSEYPVGSGQMVGPYMQSEPENGLTNSKTVVNGNAVAAATAATGFVYDYNAGAGTGKFWGVDYDPKTAAVTGLIGDND
jgi:general secretion pathway protein G